MQQAFTHSKMYNWNLHYKRKLLTYNFCVQNIDENTAKHRSCEIAGCLLHYLSNIGDNIKNVVMLSDNCLGQNKNINYGYLQFRHACVYSKTISSTSWENIEQKLCLVAEIEV